VTDSTRTTAARLRADFDAGFATPLAAPEAAPVALLAVRAGGLTVALRMDALGGVSRCPPLTAVPTTSPSLAGLCAWNGRLLGVHRLDSLLDRPGSQPGRWLVLSLRREVGLLVDALVGHFRVPAEAIRTTDGAPGSLTPAVAQVQDAALAVVDLPALLEHLNGGTAAAPGTGVNLR
jgi:chemotaxis signal transduction protein